jgi:hypothetical protein
VAAPRKVDVMAKDGKTHLGDITLDQNSSKSFAQQIDEQIKPLAEKAWASHPNNPQNKPLAAQGLTSYRYPSGYGDWIMIGANDIADAVREANRSLSRGFADVRKMQIWNANKYVSVVSVSICGVCDCPIDEDGCGCNPVGA